MGNIFESAHKGMGKPKRVTAKKHLGQHFLKDELIASDIVHALTSVCKTSEVLEIGPGMGVLTERLLADPAIVLYAIDIDTESVKWLTEHFPTLGNRLIEGDFLKLDLKSSISSSFSLIGNFPYNISSQIIFRVIEERETIPLVVGMFQKEVAERICASPRSKAYGIVSVLTQAFYVCEYLFTVNEDVFDPPPKVKSGVIRLTRKTEDHDVPPAMLFRVVKAAFNQRRKKLRNALHEFKLEDEILQPSGFSDKRAEELSVEDFVRLTHLVMDHGEYSGR